MKAESSTKVWWKETVFYEVYMPSFKDGNGDGYSDFLGLTSRLNYLEDLGIRGVWLTPFLQSPKVDNGYDVADYRKIDPVYGTLDDFKTFLSESHRRGIKVIMDMVVNHTSTEAMWFQEACKSKDNPYRDYYIWTDHPNNWESFFGGSAWELEPLTGQYYYHQFDIKMADLNWSNPRVVDEILEVLRFWLEMGVDGFRMDVINFLTTDGITKDNPLEKGEQVHLHDKDQSGVRDAIRKIRSIVDAYVDRLLIGEVGSDKIEELTQYQGEDLLDVVFNFNLGSIPEFSAQKIYAELLHMEERMPGYPTLFFGSHDMPRLLSRLAKGNLQRAEALAVLMLAAKGVPFLYYGEEIGMENLEAHSLEEIVDVKARTQYLLAINAGKSEEDALALANEHNRDRSRSPMQWNREVYAGFSREKPWLGVHPNFKHINVASLEKQEDSLLHAYKKAIALRNSEPVMQYGDYDELSFSNGCISFVRSYEAQSMRAFFNFGKKDMEVRMEPQESICLGEAPLKPDGYLILKGS